MEFVCFEGMRNNGKNYFAECGFICGNKCFRGWRVRFRIQSKWYWLFDDGGGFYFKQKGNSCFAKIFKPGEAIPKIPVRSINAMIAEAVWGNSEFVIHYNSGHTKGHCNVDYKNISGSVKELESGSVEFTPMAHIVNTGEERLLNNGFSYKGEKFVGWHLRFREHSVWYWLLSNGAFLSVNEYDAKKDVTRMVLKDGEKIPLFKDHNIESVVVEAVWHSKFSIGKRK